MGQQVFDGRRAQLATWCAQFEGCTPLSDLPARQLATAVGVVERIRLVPGESIEATITDGKGRLRATWTGRDPLRGLELGNGLRLQGTVCREGDMPTMRNPTWCLVRDPYRCGDLEHDRR